MAESMSQRGMGLMTCSLGADISEADRKRPRKTTLVTCEKRKNKMNVSGGDFGEGGESIAIQQRREGSHGRWRQRLSGRAPARCCRETQAAKDVSEPTPENGVLKSHSWSGCLRIMWCCRHQISLFEAYTLGRRHL